MKKIFKLFIDGWKDAETFGDLFGNVLLPLVLFAWISVCFLFIFVGLPIMLMCGIK